MLNTITDPNCSQLTSNCSLASQTLSPNLDKVYQQSFLKQEKLNIICLDFNLKKNPLRKKNVVRVVWKSIFLVQGEGLESRRVKKTLSIEGRECSVAFSRGETPCWRETIQKCILLQLQSCIVPSF